MRSRLPHDIPPFIAADHEVLALNDGVDVAFGEKMIRCHKYILMSENRQLPTLTCLAGVWIWEGVFVLFVVSIETGKIFLNQDRE